MLGLPVMVLNRNSLEMKTVIFLSFEEMLFLVERCLHVSPLVLNWDFDDDLLSGRMPRISGTFLETFLHDYL